MRYRTRNTLDSAFWSGKLPDGIKWLLISTTAVFLLAYLTRGTSLGEVFNLFPLAPRAVIFHLAVWQLVTYLFMHGGIWHLLFNMFTLWMFGVTIERDWGTRPFLKYYFLCGIGAGICDVTVNALLGNWGSSTIGASGAIFGVLLAFGLMYPEAEILFLFLFPIKAKFFVMIYGAIALLGALNVNSGVSNVAHLGGMLFGYLYLKSWFPKLDFYAARQRYNQYKLQRAKKKFQVYMRKHGSGRGGPWIN